MKRMGPGGIFFSTDGPVILRPQAAPDKIDQPDDGTVTDVGQDVQRHIVVTKDSLDKAWPVIRDGILAGKLSLDYLNALNIVVRCHLMMMSCPFSLKSLGHSKNADTDLAPAVDAVLNNASMLRDEEPRSLENEDLAQRAESRKYLDLYRQSWTLFRLAAESQEAGVTYLEQDLDTFVRRVYPHIADLIDSDRDVEAKLAAATRLVKGSVDLAVETRKRNEKKAEGQGTGAGSAGPGGTGPGQGTGQGPGQGTGQGPGQGTGQGTASGQGGTGQGTGPVMSGPLPVQGQPPPGKTGKGRGRSNKKKTVK